MPSTTFTTAEKLTREALYAWAGLAGFVGAYDVWAKRTGRETMSHAFQRGLSRESWPIRVSIAAAWGFTSWHLLVGQRRILNARWHARYAKVHPIWRIGAVLELKQVAEGGSPRAKPLVRDFFWARVEQST
jgi:hypothetical protein